MKIALCFIINYTHILNKEHLWREWIEPNKDIINVYFFYKDYALIKSQWIRERTIPPAYITETSYYYVVPAYLSLLRFASIHDPHNKWFCMLTDACCPIISPATFRELFFQYSHVSHLAWKVAWWNPLFHTRGNLAKLPPSLRLANDPWFVLTKEHVTNLLQFVHRRRQLTRTICDGGLANETLFAVALKCTGVLDDLSAVCCASTHLTDWTRRTSATSPHVFKYADQRDISFIRGELATNARAMFVRKVSPEFPDNILRSIIYGDK